MKTTAYFEEQVLRKRLYIKTGWCEQALRAPARLEVQEDGHRRYWIYIAKHRDF